MNLEAGSRKSIANASSFPKDAGVNRSTRDGESRVMRSRRAPSGITKLPACNVSSTRTTVRHGEGMNMTGKRLAVATLLVVVSLMVGCGPKHTATTTSGVSGRVLVLGVC